MLCVEVKNQDCKYKILSTDFKTFKYKMNKIVNEFFLAADKFILEMHLKEPGFTYNAFQFNRNKERIEKFMKYRFYLQK